MKTRWVLWLTGTLVVVGMAGGRHLTVAAQQGGGLPSVERQVEVLQQQVAALIQQIASLTGGAAIQDPAEPHLAVLRGTIGGNG